MKRLIRSEGREICTGITGECVCGKDSNIPFCMNTDYSQETNCVDDSGCTGGRKCVNCGFDGNYCVQAVPGQCLPGNINIGP